MTEAEGKRESSPPAGETFVVAPSVRECELAATAHYLGVCGPCGPFVMWLRHGKRSTFVRRESFGAFLYGSVLWFVAFLIFLIPFLGLVLCCLTLPVFLPLQIYYPLRGGRCAARGTCYRYPFVRWFYRPK